MHRFLDLDYVAFCIGSSYSSYLETKHWQRLYWTEITCPYFYWINNTFQLFVFHCKKYTRDLLYVLKESESEITFLWVASLGQNIVILHWVLLATTNLSKQFITLKQQRWDKMCDNKNPSRHWSSRLSLKLHLGLETFEQVFALC